MQTSAIIDAIATEGGFDTSSSAVSRATILAWVQALYDRALSESHWRRMTLNLGPTVAAQAEYAVPAHVVQVKSLRVDGSKPWLRITTDQLWHVEAGTDTWRDAPGVFAPNFEADADEVIRLYPAPTAAGDAISALCATVDTTALTDGAGVPALPTDLHRDLFVEGGIGMGRRIIHERPDLAPPYEGRAAEAIKRLTKRVNSRIGSGAWTAPVGRR